MSDVDVRRLEPHQSAVLASAMRQLGLTAVDGRLQVAWLRCAFAATDSWPRPCKMPDGVRFSELMTLARRGAIRLTHGGITVPVLEQVVRRA